MDARNGSLHPQYFLSAMLKLTPFLLLLPLISASTPSSSKGWPSDPIYGFEELPLNQSNFDIQRPYDIPEEERYSFQHGVHKLWVYSSDKPHTPTSRTHPRTEIRIRGYDYSSGVWQFEGYGYVPCGTTGVCIMQVFGASPHATTLMLRVYNGSLYYYRNPVLLENIYDRWFKLNVIHDVNASTVKIYIDGQLKMVAPGRGGTSHYFKCGVYEQDDGSYYMESRWKGIKVLKDM
ncbi:citrate-binding protein-like [Eucalyptus grandis]|uniref:citrate-binding protein-like n=1 Tax=Eucalyptus grandis TaxID=71139 RepID=UPI00192E7785|nr:citrate-binding protein-like [Eucalyptus grandis]